MLKFEHIDDAYKGLIQAILAEGQETPSRTQGTATLSLFSYGFKIPISDIYPLTSLKKMDGVVWRSIVSEFLWYLSGESHIRNLQKHTKIWDQWATPEGDLSFAYGRYWRRFPHPESSLPGETLLPLDHPHVHLEADGSYSVDQIGILLDSLREDPYGRRKVLMAWHPANAHVANPPACHVMAVFKVSPALKAEGPLRLNCHLTMRSNDVGLGAPFNWAQYTMLTYVLAQAVGMVPGEFSYTGVDAHLYLSTEEATAQYDQREYANKILSRETVSSPTLKVTIPPECLQGPYPLQDLTEEAFHLEGYTSHKGIKLGCVP